MANGLYKDHSDFIDSLNRRGVRYLIVGGVAVAYYGYPRYTKDIDFWIEPTEENAEKLLAALDDFGFGSLGIEPGDICEEGQIIQLGYEPRRIDLITTVKGVEFTSAWDERTQTKYHGKKLNLISRVHLITNKKAVGRGQDLVDAEKLEKNK